MFDWSAIYAEIYGLLLFILPLFHAVFGVSLSAAQSMQKLCIEFYGKPVTITILMPVYHISLYKYDMIW
jgi:hypothetical protein